MAYYPAYLELASTRRALHVGNLSYADSAEEVEKHLVKDMMQSVTPLVQVTRLLVIESLNDKGRVAM
jgi:hypothetical protein